MKRQKGFTLIELLIVVAIIGIIAAIAIPGLLRARVSANESATIGDTRTIISAQATYQSANSNWYDQNLACLANPTACIPGYPATGPVFLDSALGRPPDSILRKSGYNRSFQAAIISDIETGTSTSSAAAYVYHSTPTRLNQTGVRAFAGDASGIICWRIDGTSVGTLTNDSINTASCNILK